MQSPPRRQAESLCHRSRELPTRVGPRNNDISVILPCKGSPKELCVAALEAASSPRKISLGLVPWCLGGKNPSHPQPKSTLLHPNATVALGCETLHWVATGLSRHQIAGSTTSDPLEFKGVQGGQTEIKPRQTKKLNSGRVALGCRILCFLRCLLFNVSQKRSKLQNEPNFVLKSPISNLKSSTHDTHPRQSSIVYRKLSPHLTPIVGYCRLISAIVAPRGEGVFFWQLPSAYYAKGEKFPSRQPPSFPFNYPALCLPAHILHS